MSTQIRIKDETKDMLMSQPGDSMDDKIRNAVGTTWPEWLLVQARNTAAFDGTTVEEAIQGILISSEIADPRMSDDPYFDGWLDSTHMVQHHESTSDPVSLTAFNRNNWGVTTYGQRVIMKYKPYKEVSDEAS